MCRCPTRGDTLRAAGPPTGRTRKFSTRYGMNTTPRAKGPGSGGSKTSLAAGSLSMGTTPLWAKAPVKMVQAATAASALISRLMAFSPLEIRCAKRTVSPAFWTTFELLQRREARAHLPHEELRLLPGGEVCAFVELVVVDQLGIRLLRPTPGRRRSRRGRRSWRPES